MARQISVSELKPGGTSLFQIKPLLISLSLTLVTLSILALCIAFGPVSEKAADACVLCITIISVFLCGLLSARTKSSKGYLSGCIAGVSYVLAAYCMSAFAFGSFSPGKDFLKLLIIGISAGAFGGIVGVNTGKKRK
ncbi:MAG: TIGR04086 family membrane protein [Clostridia bacterium]|nr:TIGR04086 family membrane protein [Clostridia bacterium]